MMEIHRTVDTVPSGSRKLYVSIGMFDGVHQGHREIFRTLIDRAREDNAKSAVITFDPHPRLFLNPQSPPRILSSLNEKSAILESLGVEMVIVLPFDRKLASVEGEDFVREILVGRLHVRQIIVGYDFRLGRGRKGGRELLTELGGRYAFESEFIEPLQWEEKPVKSTWIRDEIEQGRVERAAELLDRFYSLSGTVRTGEGRGRSLGAATANLGVSDPARLWPADGVYAVMVERDEGIFPAVANVGEKPTFAGKNRTIEAHLLDFRGELVGEEITVHFISRIRDEKRFESPEMLGSQIIRDIGTAREILGKPLKKKLFTLR